MQAKVFISYSWSTPGHEDWVLELAQRLVRDGIDVVLDKWDLKEGHDKYVFMESMVNAADITKVLMILDKKYTEKADARGGGVGTETQIISPNIYAHAKQEKFIPIIAEVDEEGHPYMPAYLKSTIYIDLSKPEHFEENYEKLLRAILNRPSTVKPKLGTVPSYILEDTPMTYKTTTIVRGFDVQIDKHPERINSIVREFFDDFFENLKAFEIKNIPRDARASKEIYENLMQYLPLKNDYSDMLTKLSKNSTNFDPDLLTKLFEKTPSLLYPQNGASGWSNHQFDNFRFITHELFITAAAIFLKYERYDYLDHLFNTRYFLKDKYAQKNDPSPFHVFYRYVETITPHYEQLKGHKVGNAQADMMLSRLSSNLSKADFINGDMLCYYIDRLNHREWYPLTYIYGEHDGERLDFFSRLISKRHFEKIKGVLQAESIEELKERLLEVKKLDDTEPVRYNMRGKITPIDNMIKIDQIGALR